MAEQKTLTFDQTCSVALIDVFGVRPEKAEVYCRLPFSQAFAQTCAMVHVDQF